MGNINDIFAGDYLRAEDLPAGRPVWVEIRSVDVRHFPDGAKLELAFKDKRKHFLANMTNSRIIADLYGGETDDWIERMIGLYSTKVEFQGRMVPCIRVKPPETVRHPDDRLLVDPEPPMKDSRAVLRSYSADDEDELPF